MAAKKLMNTHETLEYLENLVVSSEEDLSDNQDFISTGTLAILPKNDKGDRDTDEDSREQFEHKLTFSWCCC